jgi:hypothetical protein
VALHLPQPEDLLAREGDVSEIVRRPTLELLRRMEEAGALGSTHLDLSRRLDLTIESFEAIARFLGRLHDGTKFWTADLLLEAEHRFGEAAYQIAAATGRSERTLGNWVWVASKVPRSRRREELSFTHHTIVAPLDLQAQQRWLERAVEERLSSRELRDAISAERGLEDGEGPDACDELLDEAAAGLRARLLECGYPADISIEIAISAPGVTFTTRTAA